MLLALTLLTGLVDAVSYRALGHGFVANRTGNVVFLGFAVAGGRGLLAVASLIALGAFVLGAMGGGRIAARSSRHRGRHLRTAIFIALPLFALAVVIAAVAGQPVAVGARYAAAVIPINRLTNDGGSSDGNNYD